MNEGRPRSFPALFERRAGMLEVGSSALRFTSAEAPAPIEIPLGRVALEVGGLNSPLIHLRDTLSPQAVITVQDLGALEVLADAGVSGADRALIQVKRRVQTRRVAMGAMLAVVALLILGLPLLVWILPSAWLGAAVSLEQERSMFAFLSREVGSRCATSAAPSQEGRLFELVEYLRTRSQELRALPPIEVCLNEAPEVNAFALPGGVLVVNQGLIGAARSVEEIAGVLAHELAHVERRHSLKAVLKGLGLGVGVAGLSFVFGTDLGEWVGRGAGLLSLGYSRSDELEADARAVRFLTAARLSPEGLIAFFDCLQASEVGGPAGKVLRLATTHPPSDERAERIRALMGGHPVTRGPLPMTLDDLARR